MAAFRVLGMIVCLLVGMVAAMTPAAAAGDTPGHQPPNDCIVYAFTYDAGTKHYSLIENNSIIIGNDARIRTDCEGGFNYTLGGQRFYSQGYSASFILPYDAQLFTIEGQNWSVEYENLTIYPGSTLSAGIEYEWGSFALPGGVRFTTQELRTHEVWIASITVILTWAVSVMALDRLAARWVSRHLVQEVI